MAVVAEPPSIKIALEGDDAILTKLLAECNIDWHEWLADLPPLPSKARSADDCATPSAKFAAWHQKLDKSAAPADLKVDSDTEYPDIDVTNYPTLIHVEDSGNSKIDGAYKRLPQSSRGRPCYVKWGLKRPFFLYWNRNWRIGWEFGSMKDMARVKDTGAMHPPCEPYPHKWRVWRPATKERQVAKSMRVLDIAGDFARPQGDQEDQVRGNVAKSVSALGVSGTTGAQKDEVVGDQAQPRARAAPVEQKPSGAHGNVFAPGAPALGSDPVDSDSFLAPVAPAPNGGLGGSSSTCAPVAFAMGGDPGGSTEVREQCAVSPDSDSGTSSDSSSSSSSRSATCKASLLEGAKAQFAKPAPDEVQTFQERVEGRVDFTGVEPERLATAQKGGSSPSSPSELNPKTQDAVLTQEELAVKAAQFERVFKAQLAKLSPMEAQTRVQGLKNMLQKAPENLQRTTGVGPERMAPLLAAIEVQYGLPALRKELATLTLGALKRKALGDGVKKAQLTEIDDAEDPKEAMIKLILFRGEKAVEKESAKRARRSDKAVASSRNTRKRTAAKPSTDAGEPVKGEDEAPATVPLSEERGFATALPSDGETFAMPSQPDCIAPAAIAFPQQGGASAVAAAEPEVTAATEAGANDQQPGAVSQLDPSGSDASQGSAQPPPQVDDPSQRDAVQPASACVSLAAEPLAPTRQHLRHEAEPLPHRTQAAGKPRLRARLSAGHRVKFPDAVDLAKEIRVTDFRQHYDDCWVRGAGVHVACDICGRLETYTQDTKLTGDPRRSSFAQDTRMCAVCVDSSARLT